MCISWAADFFCCVVVARLLPGPACDRHTIANIVASEKVIRSTALKRFMILFLFSARQHSGFSFKGRHQLAADAMRFDVGGAMLRRASEGRQAEFLLLKEEKRARTREKGNRNVTSAKTRRRYVQRPSISGSPIRRLTASGIRALP